MNAYALFKSAAGAAGLPGGGYEALFAAASQTIHDLLANPKWLGTTGVGFFGVLHRWGRDPMVFHPHVHFVVPGGGLSADETRWLSTPANFLFPAAVASRVYRQKFREAHRAAELEQSVDPAAWYGWWEVDVKPVGSSQAVLEYLAGLFGRRAATAYVSLSRLTID